MWFVVSMSGRVGQQDSHYRVLLATIALLLVSETDA